MPFRRIVELLESLHNFACVNFIKFFTAMCLMLASNAALADEKSMDFRLDSAENSRFYEITFEGGVYSIYASGTLSNGTTEKFLEFIKVKQIDSAKVYFNSMGGSLAEGMKLGRTLRALKFSTAVGSIEKSKQTSSFCVSACAYAFAGGWNRFLNQSSGNLGIHQFYSINEKIHRKKMYSLLVV